MFQTCLLLGFLSPSPSEMLLLVLIALLLYGGDLPKVARSWGKSLAELRKGLSGIQNEFNEAIYEVPRQISYHESEYNNPQYDGPTYSEPDYSGRESVVNSTLDSVPSPADESTVVQTPSLDIVDDTPVTRPEST
ncbi:twin-arginine translocase TatA/TatE family subunit [Bythopirellula polymerisocia]|uniref:Sec-independent protein translocase protein TatB n=1 Tax=Bythopirellula polymerisocia TaxID=2528003 RepID=A0A5C6CT21_9BACT|nr:twin-arginine translocase TatA/TatE family subunit [Bythopirellula polymerisocia]TWU27538.1 Sec-independent protein translocase protein TatB [Bythopirellula polymerisocia]